MMNQTLKPSVSRPPTYSPYFTNKQAPHTIMKTNQAKYRKYKLLIGLIVKASQRSIKTVWNELIKSSNRMY